MLSGTIMTNQMLTCEQALSLGLIRHDENEYFKKTLMMKLFSWADLQSNICQGPYSPVTPEPAIK